MPRLLLLCIALCTGCGDSDCPFAASIRCEEHSGPLAVSYCRPDQTWSDCTEAVQCNPLTQEGCTDGLACFYSTSWTFCAPPESYPCDPGEQWGYGVEGFGCQAHCALDETGGNVPNPPECDEGEWCERKNALPEGVGTCRYDNGDGG